MEAFLLLYSTAITGALIAVALLHPYLAAVCQ